MIPFYFPYNLILYKLHICKAERHRKADIRNPLSLLAHERSRFATCQWELLTPTDISIPPLTHRLVLYALEAGECLFCVHDMRILGRIVGVRSTEQFVWHLLPLVSL